MPSSHQGITGMPSASDCEHVESPLVIQELYAYSSSWARDGFEVQQMAVGLGQVSKINIDLLFKKNFLSFTDGGEKCDATEL